MIGDAVERSLRSPQVLISVSELFSNAAGSRMPDVQPDLLTDEVARRVVAACPTSALKVDEAAGRPHLILNYGECIACSRCVAAGNGAFRYAERVDAGTSSAVPKSFKTSLPYLRQQSRFVLWLGGR